MVRLSVGDDPAEQVQQVKEILNDLRKQKRVTTPTGDKQASLHDYEAPLRYVRIAAGVFQNRKASLLNDETELAYGQTKFRVILSDLHFVLRTIDAVTLERNLQRSEVESDDVFYGKQVYLSSSRDAAAIFFESGRTHTSRC